MIYCFDLDGTLCNKLKDYSRAKPIRERIRIVNRLYDEENTIIIDTARGSVTGIDWYSKTEKQLKKWGVKYHTLRCGVKMYADHYIDDNGIDARLFFRN